MSGYTPGKWEKVLIPLADRPKKITLIYIGVRRDGQEDIRIADVHRAPDNETQLANAGLLSAAPKLLAACREALDHLEADHKNYTNGEWDDPDAEKEAGRIIEAIAQAEGHGGTWI